MRFGTADLEVKAAVYPAVRPRRITSAATTWHAYQFIWQAATASSNPNATKGVQKHAACLARVVAKKATRSVNATTKHEPVGSVYRMGSTTKAIVKMPGMFAASVISALEDADVAFGIHCVKITPTAKF